MKVKTRTIYMLIAILVAIVSAYLLDEWYRFHKNAEILSSEQTAIVEKYYKGIGKRAYAVMSAQAKLFMRDVHAVEAFENLDRTELFNISLPYLKYMQTIFPESPATFNFHLPDGTVFLRVQEPKRFGDNLIASRKMIRAAIEKQSPAAGFETCGKSLSQRYLQPIFINGQFRGVLEIGIDVSFIANRVASISSMRNIVVINQETAKRLKCADLKSFRSVYFNNSKIPADKLFEDSSCTKLVSRIKTSAGSYEIIKAFDIVDFSGDNIAKIIFLNRSSDLSQWYRDHIIRALLISVSGIVLIIIVARRGFIDSISELEKEHDANIRKLQEINSVLEERVRKEVENCRIKDQIINQQQKVADMGLMLSALAHHWRQPINAVGLYVQDLSEAFKNNELTLEYIEEFEKNNMNLLSKLSDSIDRYRTFFEPSVERTDFDIIRILSEINEMLCATMASSGIKLTISCKCDKKEFKCLVIDKMPECQNNGIIIKGFLNEFKQTLLNMIYNSVDAINERYKKEGNVRKDGFISISIIVNEETISINITDNGTGINEDILDKVFNPFFTTKEEGKGTGIGLYMAKTVIEKYMCGTLTARNTGNGTEMLIVLHKEPECL